MTRFDDGCRAFEEALNRDGLPALCLVHEIADPRESDYDPWNYLTLELVIPMGEEVHVREKILDHGSRFEDWFGTEPQFLIRTVLYHLAYSVFGKAAAPAEGTVVSTNIIDLFNPNRRKRDQIVAYYYSLRIVIIDAGRAEPDLQPMVKRITNLAKAFNRSSRYLKIGNLEWARARSRLVGTPEPRLVFRPVSLNHH